MKKPTLLGALFGLLIVPISIFGLVNQTIERLAPPFTFVPRIVVSSVIDTATSPGGLSMGLLLLISVLFYALVGYVLGKISRAYGKWIAIGAAVVLYLVLVMLNAAFLL